MNVDVIAATVLFGPAVVAAPATALAWWRYRGEHDAALAVLAEHRATSHQARPDTPPPDGGQPNPATDQLADVIPLPKRHAA